MRDMEYIVEDMKTSDGAREIPMTDDVYQCFRRVTVNRLKPKTEPVGALYWEHYFRCKCRKSSRTYIGTPLVPTW